MRIEWSNANEPRWIASAWHKAAAKKDLQACDRGGRMRRHGRLELAGTGRLLSGGIPAPCRAASGDDFDDFDDDDFDDEFDDDFEEEWEDMDDDDSDLDEKLDEGS